MSEIQQPMQLSLTVVRAKEVVGICGFSLSTLYDKQDPKSPRHDPSFPRPLRLGKSAVGWVKQEVIDWLLSQRRIQP
jgi:prophage regulatory protein